MILSRVSCASDLEELLHEMSGEDFLTVSFTTKEGDDMSNPRRHALIASVDFLEQFAWSDDLQLGNAPACSVWGENYIGTEPSFGGMGFTYHAPDNMVALRALGLRAKTFSCRHWPAIIGQLKALDEFVRDARVRAYRSEEILAMADNDDQE